MSELPEDAAPTPRPVERVVAARRTSDGAGVILYRSLGGGALPELDPFLMLDEFRSDDPTQYVAGFPDHPHRGFETVTYMLAGRMRHADNLGNGGLLGPGGAQWMTAGRGIIHSEMPEQEEGLIWGFQLWVNLPARDKMTAPRYQDIDAAAIPSVALAPGVAVRLVAGRLGAVAGPVGGVATDPVYLDVSLAAGAAASLPLPRSHAGFAYVFEGAVELGRGAGARPVERGHLAVLGAGDRAEACAADGAARFLLVGGRPIGEPVARYGPFVMSSAAEIRQAVLDYQSGRF